MPGAFVLSFCLEWNIGVLGFQLAILADCHVARTYVAKPEALDLLARTSAELAGISRAVPVQRELLTDEKRAFVIYFMRTEHCGLAHLEIMSVPPTFISPERTRKGW